MSVAPYGVLTKSSVSSSVLRVSMGLAGASGEIAPAAERLLHELTAFVLAQRERWDAGFFSGLVFWGRPYS